MILLKYILDLPINHDLKNYVCYELLEDNDGRLWIGTNNGIYIYDKQKQTLQHIGKKEGMPSNVVCGLEKMRKEIFGAVLTKVYVVLSRRVTG